MLERARRRAGELSHRGALYPWRTIDGEECSAYFPAGTAQYHINADIVFALRRYVEATGDRDLLLEGGAEMVFETARLWADLGTFVPERDGRFCIHCVTGPDEYTALVDNNLYTNVMAKSHLEYAVETARELARSSPGWFDALRERIGLKGEEIEVWERAAEAMLLPYDAERGVHPQDDSFLRKARWPFEQTPRERYPLLLHYHPLVIYRHQVLKQPDVVLAMVLQGHRFSTAEKRRNFEYYDPLTTGDSSLSACVQCIAASELGYSEKALLYFRETARIDLDDTAGNTRYGVHAAAMGGTWLALVCGFAGMRDSVRPLSFHPRLPAQWSRLSFRLHERGSTFEVDIRGDSVVYTLVSGPGLAIRSWGADVHLHQGRPVTLSLARRLEAVLLDLDGVVTDTAELHYRAWKRLAEELDLSFDRAYNENLKGVGRLESLDLILKRGGRSFSEKKRLALADRKNEYYGELIEGITPGDLLPGIRAFLEELRRAGIKTALVSASRNAPAVVRRLRVASLFDATADPNVVSVGKPDPEIFFQAADRLGVPYRNCVGVEDAQAGVEAIRAAGMFAVAVGAGLRGADWRVAETAEFTLEALSAAFERAASDPAAHRAAPRRA